MVLLGPFKHTKLSPANTRGDNNNKQEGTRDGGANLLFYIILDANCIKIKGVNFSCIPTSATTILSYFNKHYGNQELGLIYITGRTRHIYSCMYFNIYFP